jgi:hypothetical protein
LSVLAAVALLVDVVGVVRGRRLRVHGGGDDGGAEGVLLDLYNIFKTFPAAVL